MLRRTVTAAVCFDHSGLIMVNGTQSQTDGTRPPREEAGLDPEGPVSRGRAATRHWARLTAAHPAQSRGAPPLREAQALSPKPGF